MTCTGSSLMLMHVNPGKLYVICGVERAPPPHATGNLCPVTPLLEAEILIEAYCGLAPQALHQPHA